MKDKDMTDTTDTTGMTKSWLVQRLEKPAFQVGSPFAFGGGLKNGGLSDDAMNLLGGIFQFDYMGAAEFEWGAVPKALKRMAANAASRDGLVTGSFKLAVDDIAEATHGAPASIDWETTTIWFISPPGCEKEVEKRIRKWASSRYDNDLKEETLLSSVLRPSKTHMPRTKGWFELDNGFMFFVDEEMWRKTCQLFGVEAPD